MGCEIVYLIYTYLKVELANGSKSDMRLVDYYNDMNDEQKVEFCKHAMIPNAVSLEIECIEKFYEERKTLLTKRISELLG